jgi:cytochrome P450
VTQVHTEAQVATADPWTAVGAEERQRVFAELAARGPVQRIAVPGGEVWLVTGQAEARQAMTDPRLVKTASPTGEMANRLVPELYAGLRQHLLLKDGPEHTRLRRLVGSAFTRRRVESLEPRIAEIADTLLDAAALVGDVDLLKAYACPLPMTVICELIGVPEHLRDRFQADFGRFVGGAFTDPDSLVAGVTGLVTFCRELVEGKRREPADDLLSALVAVQDGGDRLSEDELTSMIFLLVAAGHETTVNLIGNAVYALLTRPDQLAALQADPALLPDAIEELLRFDGPVQTTFTLRALEPLTLGGVRIAAGETVLPALLAANRDPSRECPHVLDVTREYTPHLAFGYGIHHCLGAPLARLEARVALGTLIRRFPDLRLAVPADSLRRRPNTLFHAFEALPVSLL